MKLESSFKKFLEDVVNLNITRYDIARSSIDTMKGLLQSDDIFGDKFIDAYPQGSFRQETIIKPVDESKDFDVDLFFEMEIVEDWQPKDYLEKLADQFRKMPRYVDKVDTRGKSRCVTIDYETDFHVDIVPSISSGRTRFVMNKKDNVFEPTDGEGYAFWFEGQNAITQKKHLTKVVRLMKYLRDSKEEFEAKSILLTTLLGNQVLPNDDPAHCYPDLPTAFFVLIDRLNSHLQENPSMPTVTNPALPEEDFNRHWDQEKYSSFRDCIERYAYATKEAYFSDSEAESLKKWQEIFGDQFTSPSSSLISGRDSGEEFLSDYGIPENIQYRLKINSKVHQDGWQDFLLREYSGFLAKLKKLKWFVEDHNIPGEFSIKWKVKNTGKEAREAGDLRGKILDDNGTFSRSESTKYWGAHYVECYAIKDGVCVAKDRCEVHIDRQ